MMPSINSRLLLATSVIMTCFLGITAFTLDQAYQENAQIALRDKLQSYVVALIAGTELQQDNSIRPPEYLADIRYSIPHSGLYAEFRHNTKGIIWRSTSAYGRKIPFSSNLARAEKHFEIIHAVGGEQLFCFSLGVSWDVASSRAQSYTISVAESPEVYYTNLSSYRRSLWSWLGTLGVILLVVQTIILRWGLRPLREVSDDLKDIEGGAKFILEGKYPPELRPLTDNLNGLLNTQHEHLKRYRNTLGDLAHSLKTPLALIRSTVDSNESASTVQYVVREQVEHMTEIIHYQLQRAATSGRTALAAPLEFRPHIEKLLGTLRKVYAEKQVDPIVILEAQTHFYGDEGDMMELLGNLIDNSFKWCDAKVRISARNIQEVDKRDGLILTIEDDGPGIEPDKIDQVLQRGMRADESTHGHGIGLAIVRDIVTAYGGKLQITRSDLGGARIEISFPPQ